MRDGNGSQTSQALYLRNGRVIDQAHAIPEDVALLVLKQQSAFPYSESRHSSNANQAGFVLSELIAKTVLLKLAKRGPLLSLISDILALVLADWAVLRRLLARGKLCATCLTDPMLHRFFTFFEAGGKAPTLYTRKHQASLRHRYICSLLYKTEAFLQLSLSITTINYSIMV